MYCKFPDPLPQVQGAGSVRLYLTIVMLKDKVVKTVTHIHVLNFHGFIVIEDMSEMIYFALSIEARIQRRDVLYRRCLRKCMKAYYYATI